MGDMSREPSMEEILSSIRRVIARDEPALDSPIQDSPPNPSQSPPLRKTPPPHGLTAYSPETDDGDDDDVLDLTEASTEDEERESVQAYPTMDPAAAALVAEEPAAASRQSLDVLAALLASGQEAAPAADPAIASDLTVNAMVDAALRPMLKTWLDANLPGVVERLVAREIARITGNRL